MNSIGAFLQKYLNFTPPALVRARAVSKAVSEKFGITCPEEWITIRGDVAFVRTEGMLKSEIALNKSELLKRIELLGGGVLSDLK